MEGFKGAPGPWSVSFHGSDNCWIVDAENDSAIAKVTRYKGDGVVQKANFQLIAAAPELLEALQNLIAAYQPVASADNPAVNEAIRAVNKALGQ